MPNQATYWAMNNLSGEDSGGADLFVTVKGTKVPVAQFSMSYGLNSIPTATALIALGRDARTGEDSAIYDLAADLKQMTEIKVELQGNLGDWVPQGAGGARVPWPGGTHVLFVGYAAGISYRRSLGRVSLVLNMKNQLVDLSMSSGGSADVVPGAPHDLMMPTGTEGAGGELIGTAAGRFTNELPTDLNTDFSEGILKSLHNLSQENQLQVHKAWCEGLSPPGPVQAERSNDKAANVIEGVGDWLGIANFTSGGGVTAGEYPGAGGGPASTFSKAYPLQIHDKGREHTAQRIGDVIAASLSGTSMWSMLIGSLIPEFGVSVIPLAQSAIIAPVIPMCKQEYKVLEPKDYADFNLKTLSTRPLYGVAVMGNYSTATLDKAGTDNKQCVGETFVAKADDGEDANDGMWMFVPAPRWMDDWTNYDPEALTGDAAAVKMLTKPSHDAVGVDDEAVDRSPDDEVDDWNDVMQKYARMMYAANALRGREGTVVGKLRFDISPGSTILINSKGSLQSDGTDELAVPLYGFVSRVTVTINSEQASANTTFELTNIRNEVENESSDGRFSMDTHPFFDTNFFNGAPLVPSMEVTP